MKYGNESQIDLIVAEVGGAIGAAPLEAQSELFNALIDGCTEAVELGSLDPKVGNFKFFQSMCGIGYLYSPYFLRCLFYLILHPGAIAGFFWCPSEGE